MLSKRDIAQVRRALRMYGNEDKAVVLTGISLPQVADVMMDMPDKLFHRRNDAQELTVTDVHPEKTATNSHTHPLRRLAPTPSAKAKSATLHTGKNASQTRTAA